MILVTGSTGFVGTHLVHALSGTHKIKCLHRKSPKSTFPNCEIILGDLLNYESLLKATDGVDTIVHLAGVISSKDPEYFAQVNVKGMENLVNASIKNNVKKIIFTSSGSVTFGQDPYTLSKEKAEKMLIESGLKSIILRPAEIYGEGDNKGINSLINVVRNFPVIPIIGKGDYTLQPVYIDDIIYAIMQFINLEFENYRIYNIAGSSALTFNDVIDTISECLEIKRFKFHIPIFLAMLIAIVLENISSKPFINRDQVSRITTPDKQWDLAKIVKDINFHPLSFREGIKKTISTL